MILNSISLENIRSYKNGEIEFPRGITLFQGDIGTGKSSVLMAVEFALFGLGSQKADALLKTKAKDGSVTLNFEGNETQYQIKRTLKRGKNSVTQDTGYIISNGVKENLSASELKPRVLQILKFNEPPDPRSESRIYRYAVFTPQEEMKSVLKDPSKRLETLRKAFGIEDYKIAVDNARYTAGKIEFRMNEAKMGFKDIDVLQEKLKENTNELNVTKTKLAEQKTKIKSVKDELESIKKQLQDLQNKTKEKIQLESEIERLTSEIENKNSNLQSISEQLESENEELSGVIEESNELKQIKKPTTKTIKQLDKEIKTAKNDGDKLISIKSDIKSLSKSIQDLSKKLFIDKETNESALHAKIKNLESEIKKNQQEFDDNKKTLRNNERSESKLESDMESLTKNLHELAEAGAKCPVCENPLDESHVEHLEKERKEKLKQNKSMLEKIQNKITEISNIQESLEEQINQKKKERSELENQIPILAEIKTKSNDLHSMEEEASKLEKLTEIIEEKDFANTGEFEDNESYLTALRSELAKYEESRGEIKKLEKKAATKQKKVTSLEKKKVTLSSTISALQKSLPQKKNKLSAFQEIENQISMLQKNESQSSSEKSMLEKELGSIEANVDNLNKESDRLNGEIKSAERFEQKYSLLSNYNEWITDFFIPTVELVERQIMISIQQDFNKTYQNWFSMMIEDPTKQSRIDEDFTPLVEQDGVLLPTDYFSGGEKTSIALAYRLTLNTLMRQETDSLKSNLLILDEPTDGFSKSQLYKIRPILQELNSQQIILVSHERELESYVENIFRVTKENGLSNVTRL